MGRCKDFEEQEVLKKALACFWEKGYEATSTRDLAKAMGISYGSFYHTFKDKRTLYLEALDLYIHTYAHPLIQQLEQASSAKPAIEAILQRVAEESARNPSGCLAGNAVLELANQDQEIAQKVRCMNNALASALERLLVRARDAGEINPKNDLSSIAHFIVNTLSGIRLAARLRYPHDKMQGIIRVTLSAI